MTRDIFVANGNKFIVVLQISLKHVTVVEYDKGRGLRFGILISVVKVIS